MVATIFVTSGWSHLRDPEGRAQSIGTSPAFTMFLGAAELAGGLGVVFGVLTQLAAIGLILVMLGAIHRKFFVTQASVAKRHPAGITTSCSS
jgi:putative oxidoreductase